MFFLHLDTVYISVNFIVANFFTQYQTNKCCDSYS